MNAHRRGRTLYPTATTPGNIAGSCLPLRRRHRETSWAGRLVLTLLFFAVAGPTAAERTFYWSMETETPEVCPADSSGTPYYYPVQLTLRTNAQAHGGTWSLDLSGQAWRQATFDNPTTRHVWASPQQGAIVVWWMHTGGIDGHMLMQLTGKSRDKRLDTNDGISLRFKGNSELIFGYGWNDSQNGTRVRYRHGQPFEPNRWYRVTARWNTASAPHLSLHVDDAAPVTTDEKPGATRCATWHHLLWGNDLRAVPPGLYLDDVEVWNDSEMRPAESRDAAAGPG
jgi:hypothetical protein